MPATRPEIPQPHFEWKESSRSPEIQVDQGNMTKVTVPALGKGGGRHTAGFAGVSPSVILILLQVQVARHHGRFVQ